MANFWDNVNDQLKKFLNDEDQLIARAKETLSEKTFTFPITSDMLLHILQKKRLRGIVHLEIKFKNGNMVIRGIAKKLVLIRFMIQLMPEKVDKRIIYFKVIKVHPLNQKWIRGMIFNRPPLVKYDKDQELVGINLNSMPQLSNIPIGNLKGLEIKDDKCFVSIGV